MKKIFTLLVLSIMAMTSIFAGETVLWEGSWYVSWDEPEGSEHREWKHLGQADFAAYEVGTTVCFYMEQAEGATYAKYQIDNWSWVLLPGQTATDFSGNTVAKLPITQEVKDSIAAGGFAIHGHGFNVVKATLTDETVSEEEEPQPQGDVLWEGDWFVSWHYADSDTENVAHKQWNFLSQATFAALEEGSTLYILLEANPILVDPNNSDDQLYSKYALDNGWWKSLPGQAQTAFVNDTVATLPITAEVKADVAEKGGFAIHGHGFNVKKVSLSPIEITPTAVDNVAIKNDGIRYNLMGQRVDENYKGVVILNGRKMIVR